MAPVVDKIVNGPEVLSKFVGETEKNVRDLFADAENDQRTRGDESDLHVIIFDEIDAICKSRGSTRDGTGVHDSIVNQLLTKIDGVESLNNVLLIGMTNRKDLLDEALLRPGRLEVQVEISLPDENGRLQILHIHTNKMKENSFLAPDVNLQELAYATRTIFLLTQMGTLKPIAIELSLPNTNPFKPSKKVITPPVDATTWWQWQLAKAHVCSSDSGAHELIQHWLRTHACMEPFIVAARRQLSAVHPIHKLLHPHMRYTMDINAGARELLISAGGIIESLFSTKESSMEITSFAYKNWRFDMESLPADLIRRGVAEADPTEPHGIKLLIEDYPYANDGLLIWSAIERLVKDYVNYYYPDSNSIRSDPELSTWYYESINVGHADLRHEAWWPNLSTPDDLVSILATLIWISSAKHAALNFGQYHYGGYVPVRPSYMRRLIPNEEDPEYQNFMSDPEGYFLSSLPSLREMAFLMTILDILSTHSEDEEYLGDRKELSTWRGSPEIIEAFYRFSTEMKGIEKEIEKRNRDTKLRNRCGAGVFTLSTTGAIFGTRSFLQGSA